MSSPDGMRQWNALAAVLVRDVALSLTLTDIVCLSLTSSSMRTLLRTVPGWTQIFVTCVQVQFEQTKQKVGPRAALSLLQWLLKMLSSLTRIPEFTLISPAPDTSNPVFVSKSVMQLHAWLKSECSDAIILAASNFVQTVSHQQDPCAFDAPPCLNTEAEHAWREQCAVFERWLRSSSKLSCAERMCSFQDMDDMRYISENVWLNTHVNSFCSRFPQYHKNIPELLQCSRSIVMDHFHMRQLQLTSWSELLSECHGPALRNFRKQLKQLQSELSTRDLARRLDDKIIPAIRKAHEAVDIAWCA